MADVSDLYRLVYGRDPEPWQSEVLERMFARDSAGDWATNDVHTGGADQTIRDLRAIVGAFIFDERVMYSCRSASATAETYRRLQQMVTDHPELRRRVRSFRGTNGGQRIEVDNGCVIAFITRSSRVAGRGFSVDCVVSDEGIDREARAMAGFNLAASKRPQLVH